MTTSKSLWTDKSGWAPLGAGEDQTHPVFIALVGVGMVVVLPLVWGLIRRTQGLPMFGSPTVAELEGERPPGAATSVVGAGSGPADDQTQVP